MKNNLWTFGCSFTEIFLERLHDIKSFNNSLDLYLKKYNEVDLVSWQEIVSNEFDLNLKNFGYGASCNYQIFQSICDESSNFQKNDIIIIEWTNIIRTRTPRLDTDGLWEQIAPGNYMSDRNKIELFVGRERDVYKEEIISYMNLINKLSDTIGCNLYYWTIDWTFLNYLRKNKKFNHQWLFSDELNNSNKNYIKHTEKLGGKLIVDELGVKDPHFGISGNKVFGDITVNYIKKGLDSENFSYRG